MIVRTILKQHRDHPVKLVCCRIKLKCYSSIKLRNWVVFVFVSGYIGYTCIQLNCVNGGF